MSNDLKFAKFIRGAVRPAADYTRLSLVQVMSGGGSNVLQNEEIDKENHVYDQEKIDEIAAVFLARAQEDADGHTGLTSYCLIALRGVTKGERSAIIRLRSQDSEFSEALGDTEPATKDGHLAQLMRHNEALMRQNVQLMEVMSNQSSAIIARQAEQIKHYEDRHWETMVRAEELADERDNRELRKLKEVGREKRFDEALKTFKPLVPVLVSKIKGVPSDAKAALNLEALKSVMANLDGEKMEQIANILGPQSLALLELWLEANKEKATEEGSPTH